MQLKKSSPTKATSYPKHFLFADREAKKIFVFQKEVAHQGW